VTEGIGRDRELTGAYVRGVRPRERTTGGEAMRCCLLRRQYGVALNSRAFWNSLARRFRPLASD